LPGGNGDSIILAEHAKLLDAHPNYWRAISAFLSERSS
jgi:hypothetical protein